MTDIVDESNEKHLEPWSEACQRDKIENTPLSPYLDQVMIHGLIYKHMHKYRAQVMIDWIIGGFLHYYRNFFTKNIFH